MQNLTLNDIQILNEGIQQLYSLHDLDTFAVKSLLIIDRIVPIEIPLFHIPDVHIGQIQDTFFAGYPGLTPELSRIKQLYLGEQPIAQNIHQDLHRDKILLNLLRPHLLQAYINAQTYQKLEHKLDPMSEIQLNTDGRVLWIGLQSLRLLDKYFRQPNFYLQFPDYLWSWVKACANSPIAYSPLKIQSKNYQLTIKLTIKETENIYLLSLEEEVLSLLDSLRILDLSERETEVLAGVIRGKDNQSIAADLGIGIGTIRKHLENIYRKWKVSSRTEAIAKTLEKLDFLQQ